MSGKKVRKILGALWKAGGTTIGTIWSIMEIVSWYFPKWKVVEFYQNHVGTIIFPAVAVMLCRGWLLWKEEHVITFSIKGGKVRIRTGDILRMKHGLTVVGINRQLNTAQEQIGERSIHRAVLDKYGQKALDLAFENGRRQIEAGRQFFQEKLDGREFLFLCMSDLNENAAASTTMDLMRNALDDLFFHQNVLRVPEGRIYIPILGTGEGGFCLNKLDTIKFIVERFGSFQRQVDENSTVKIKELCVVIYRKDNHEIDWGNLRVWAGQMGQYCMECPKFGE